MIILGAGMAGCIAGIVNPAATILESNDSPPTNHNAVLRFRSDAVSKVTGIPFKKVKVQKAIWFNHKEHHLSPRMANLYSQKVLGIISPRSITNLDTVIRYVAPADFHSLLIEQCGSRIRYGMKVNEISRKAIGIDGDFPIPREGVCVVSTMPMTVLAQAIGIPIPRGKVEFNFKRIITSRYKISNCDTYQTIYFPEPDIPLYRATLTGCDLILESMQQIDEEQFSYALSAFGVTGTHRFEIVVENHEQRYGKIQEIDAHIRRSFIHTATLEYGVYSLGRFATWRNILLDDVLDDIYVINKLKHSDIYSHLLGA